MIAFAVAGCFFSVSTYAQRGPQGPPPTPKAIAPVDFTGYWVSVVTSDWRFRMINPEKGDYESLPLTAEGRRVANTWDPAKGEVNSCLNYGAAAIMRVPERLHITWANENTLKIETDAGTQTRLLQFGEQLAQAGEPRLQGYSIAKWEAAAISTGIGPRPNLRDLSGALTVVTTHMRAGYVRKNGVPYSGNAVLTEYYTRMDEANGDSWLLVESILDDPIYFDQPFITSTPFKRQADASGWNPTGCAER
jgi:hypothetical protein